MKNKRIKKLHLYLAAFSILLSGCSIQSVHDTVTAVNEDFSNQIEQLEKEIGELKRSLYLESDSPFQENTYFQSEFAAFGESVYFQKGNNTTVTYDDMILTMEERGIGTLSPSAKSLIKSISFYNGDKFDTFWVSLFEIESYYQLAYTNSNVSSSPSNHRGSEFYNKITDTINWNRLTNVICQNSLNMSAKDRSIESLSREEVCVVLDQIKEFSADIKEKYPDFDLAHLACQLSTLSLVYGANKNDGTLATTSAYSIEWFLSASGAYPVLQTSLGLNEHEFKHFLCQYCSDEVVDKSCYVVPSGVSYGNHDALKFSFIEEATAEEYSAQRNSNTPITYFDKIAILDNLRFVLSMQEDYEADGFFKYSLFRNPLAMVQQFPVMEDQTYFFVDNLKMLASYNTCLMSSAPEFDSKVMQIPGYGNFKTDLEQMKEIYSSLLNYAQIELSRLFFTNLIIMNEAQESMTLEYNFYLMRLFEKRMDAAYDIVSSSKGVSLSSANFNALQQERTMFMLKYLSEKFQLDITNVKELYEEYALSDGVTHPSFVDDSIISFYSYLENQEYSTKNANLQNYIQYAYK